MPKLPKKIAKLDDVPEAYRGLYAKDGEAFARSGGDGEIDLPDPSPGLEKNRDDILREFRAFKQKFEGVDPEEYRKLKKADGERATKDLESKGQYDAALKAAETKHGEEKSALEKRVSGMVEQLNQSTLESAVMREFDGKRIRVLLPEGGGGPVRSRVKFVETSQGSGTFTMQVLDKSGNVIAGDDKDSAIKKLLNELKATDDYGVAWDATGVGGSGAPGGRAGGHAGASGKNSVTRSAFEAMEPTAQHAHIQAGGIVTE